MNEKDFLQDLEPEKDDQDLRDTQLFNIDDILKEFASEDMSESTEEDADVRIYESRK